MPECREQPFPGIIVQGALQDCKVAIIAEKQMLCEFSGGLVDATIGYMAAHYVFMFKYACSLNNFCLVLHKCVLQIQDGKRLPSTVISFVNELNLISKTN